MLGFSGFQCQALLIFGRLGMDFHDFGGLGDRLGCFFMATLRHPPILGAFLLVGNRKVVGPGF